MASILLDSCVWGGAIDALRAQNHTVDWAGLWEQDPGDQAVLKHAYEKQQILVTLDKDFGELAIVKGQPHRGIIRLAGFKATQMAAAIHYIVNHYDEALATSAIITVDPQKIRVRI